MIDSYKHLNKNSKVTIQRDKIIVKIDIEDIAGELLDMNYGVHRLLSALVRQRKEKKDREFNFYNSILPEIENLLNKGYY